MGIRDGGVFQQAGFTTQDSNKLGHLSFNLGLGIRTTTQGVGVEVLTARTIFQKTTEAQNPCPKARCICLHLLHPRLLDLFYAFMVSCHEHVSGTSPRI